MKNILVIGAGNFGQCLIKALAAHGHHISVLDKERTPELGLKGVEHVFVHGNVWNLPMIDGIEPESYDCCYMCIGGKDSLRIRAVEILKKAGMKNIIATVATEECREQYMAAGAVCTICPAELASRVIASGISEEDSWGKE